MPPWKTGMNGLPWTHFQLWNVTDFTLKFASMTRPEQRFPVWNISSKLCLISSSKKQRCIEFYLSIVFRELTIPIVIYKPIKFYLRVFLPRMPPRKVEVHQINNDKKDLPPSMKFKTPEKYPPCKTNTVRKKSIKTFPFLNYPLWKFYDSFPLYLQKPNFIKINDFHGCGRFRVQNIFVKFFIFISRDGDF